MDLTEFLTARLDEKEARARSSGPGRVAWLSYRDSGGQMLYTTVAASTPEAEDAWCADGKLLPEAASVRVFYDTARALREVAADRAILAEHRQWVFGGATGCSVCHAGHELGDPSPGPCPTLRAMATVDSDHPDYDPAWAQPGGGTGSPVTYDDTAHPAGIRPYRR